MSNLARTIHKNEEIESGTALISKKIPVMLVPFFEGSDYTLEQTHIAFLYYWLRSDCERSDFSGNQAYLRDAR